MIKINIYLSGVYNKLYLADYPSKCTLSSCYHQFFKKIILKLFHFVIPAPMIIGINSGLSR